VLAAACGSTSPNSSGGSGGGSGGSGSGGGAGTTANSVKSGTIGGAHVLTTAKGFTVYWFVIDPKNQSKCYGQCAHYWPPVKGPVSAGSGVSGTFGVITRKDGSKQATWNGHPIYTYLADTAAGMDKGNNLNASGGVWKDVVLSGSAAASKPSTSGGGGY
jgi:predicted lipoprotein with Yx(FWY)xxD motif